MGPPSTDTPLLELEGLVRRFGEQTALAGLDLRLDAGEVVGLLGRNGAGKTTALRILCGLLAQDAGVARVLGRDVREDPLAARRALAFVPDGAPLYAQLSGLEHLRLVGRLHELEEPALEKEARRLLEAFELGPFSNLAVAGYSRGMRQKLALACALLPKPRILVLDEPLTGLDAPSTSAIKELLRLWADRGGAVLYTSHLLDVVERVCDRVVILDQGRLVAQGRLDELRQQAGNQGSLEELFRELTRAEDPRQRAAQILG